MFWALRALINPSRIKVVEVIFMMRDEYLQEGKALTKLPKLILIIIPTYSVKL